MCAKTHVDLYAIEKYLNMYAYLWLDLKRVTGWFFTGTLR